MTIQYTEAIRLGIFDIKLGFKETMLQRGADTCGRLHEEKMRNNRSRR